MTPERRLSDCNFIQGDEPLESRIQRILDEGLIREFYIDDCEDALFYRKFDCYGGRMLDRALKESRQNLKLRKILAGGNYPEARSAVVEGVDLDELAKIPVSELELTSRAQGRIRQYFKISGYYIGGFGRILPFLVVTGRQRGVDRHQGIPISA